MFNKATSGKEWLVKSHRITLNCFLLLLSLHMYILVWIFTRKSKTRTKCCVLTAACAMVWEAPERCHYHLDLPHSPSREITSLMQSAMSQDAPTPDSAIDSNTVTKIRQIKSLLFNPNVSCTPKPIFQDCLNFKGGMFSFSPHSCFTPLCFLCFLLG